MSMTVTKDPDARLDYAVNWGSWMVDGDTITTSTWTADPGLTIEADAFDGTRASVWASGGEARNRYKLTNRITTAAGRTDERTLHVSVNER